MGKKKSPKMILKQGVGIVGRQFLTDLSHFFTSSKQTWKTVCLLSEQTGMLIAYYKLFGFPKLRASVL